MSKRNEILETCLARLTAGDGDSVENCLADYPADAEWLRPYLAAASQLNTLPPQQLSPTADKAIQRHLRQATQQIRTASLTNASRPRQRQIHFLEDGMKNMSRFLTKWLPRAALAGTAVALLFIFITQFTNLLPSLSSPITEPAADLQPANVTTVGNSTITMEADLSADPGEVPLYHAQTEPVPTTPEEVLAWAQNFGLPGPELFRSTNDSDSTLHVLGSDGQRLGFQNYQGFSEIFYSNPAASINSSGERVPFDEAADIAVAFLQTHNLLPDSYQVEPALGSGGSVQQIIVWPQVAGGRLSGSSHGAATRVGVSADGQITYATFGQVTLEPAGTTTVISAQQAYDDLINGRNVLGGTYSTAGPDVAGFRSYQPPLPTWEVGQTVDLVGYLDVMVNVQTGTLRVALTSSQGTFLLSGSDLDALSEQGQRGSVRVQGAISEQHSPNSWRVAVENWETVPPAEFNLPCLIGTLSRAGAAVQFHSEDGTEYALPDAPEEIAAGEQMQICLSALAEPGDELAWYNINVPPPGPGIPPGGVVTEQVAVAVEEVSGSGSGGGGSGSIVTEQVVVEQVLEVTRVVTEDVGEASSAGISVEAVPQAAPPEFIEPTNPYEIGDAVELTGVVQLYRIVAEDGTERLEATFANDGDQGEASYPLTYALLADRELLAEMAEFSSLHIRVYGRVVAAPDTDMFMMPGGEQAIEVDSFDRPWPEEKMDRFLGHFSLEEVEGQQVLIFTDHASDQQYVISPTNMPPEVYEHEVAQQADQILLTGIVHPVNTFGGLPLLERRGTSSSPEITQATDVSEIPMDEHNAIPMINEADMQRRDGLGGIVRGDVVIERVELVYPYQPQPTPTDSKAEPPLLEPVWAFYGRSPDGLEQFIIHVRATIGG